MTVPEIVDYDLPVAGAFHNCVIVSIRKAFPGHAQKVMHAIWGSGCSASRSRRGRRRARGRPRLRGGLLPRRRERRPERDVLLTEGPLDHLDHAPTHQFFGGKLGIDATAQGPGRGDPRAGRTRST